MRGKPLLVAAFLSCCAISAQGAVVYLRDGGKVEGTVVSATARDVEVHTSGGSQRIPAENILRIDYAASEPQPSSPPAAAPAYREAPRRADIDYGDRDQMFSMNFGIGAPLNDVDFSPAGGGSDRNGGPGPLIGAQYLYFVSPRLGLGADLTFFHRDAASSPNLVPSADTNVFGNSTVLLGVLKYTLTDSGWARPYLLGGLGGYRSSTYIDATPQPGFAWSDTGTAETRLLVDDGASGLAAALRAGIDFDYYAPILFSLEFGWTRLANATYHATPAGQNLGLSGVSGPLSFFNIAGRCGWRF